MPYPVFQDIAVIQKILVPGKNPIGEAPKQGEVLTKLTIMERQSTLERIYQTVESLVLGVGVMHQGNKCYPGSTLVNPDYMTRLSTDEFFFIQKNH